MILGVTGGIATGKSSVTEQFRVMGLPIVSADELARVVVRVGTDTLPMIVERFGAEVLCPDGSLNRERLAQIIFADDTARRDLNQIIHPAIARLAESTLASLVAAGATHIVYEVPLLYEVGAESRVDKVLVVSADSEVQIKRLMARDGVDRTAAKARIASQMSLEEKINRADYVIDNSGTPDETARQVRDLCHELTISVAG